MITIPLCARTKEYCKLVDNLSNIYTDEELQQMLNDQVDEDKSSGLFYHEYESDFNYDAFIDKMRDRKILVQLTRRGDD